MARQGPHVSRFFPVTEEVASPVARAITKTNTQMRVTETKCPIGKGAIVGVAGEMEHGGACVHPMLGKPMRGAIGGGKAVIGSNVKVAVLQALLSTCRSGIKTIRGHSRISTPSRSRWPMPLDPTRSWW